MASAEEILVWMKLRGQAAVVRGLAQVETAAKRVSTGVRGMGNSMEHSKKKAGIFRQSLTIMRKSLVGLTAASSAFIAVGLVKGSLDFEDSMQRVKATLTGNKGFGPKQFKALQESAMHWAEVTRFSSAEVSDGLFKLVSNGFSAQEALQALGGTTDLAGASMVDMTTAANIQTNVLKQFGFQANKARYVADVLVKAVNAGSAEMVDLQNSLKYIGPVAATFGTNLQQTVSALEVMAQGGFRGAFAGRALRTGFVRLVKPTKDVTKGLRIMGLNIKDVQGKKGLLPLPKLLDVLRGKLNKLPGAKGKEAVARIFGTEAVTQWLYLIRHSGKPLDKMSKEISKNKNAAREFSEMMLKTTRGSLEQFGNTVQDLVTRLIVKYSPNIQSFFNALSDGLNDLRNPNSKLRKQLKPLVTIMESLFGIVHDLGETALPMIKTGFGIALAVLKPVAAVLKKIANEGETTKAVMKALLIGFVTWKVLMGGKMGLIGLNMKFRSGMQLLNATMKANPLIFWVTVGTTLVILLIELYKHNETFRHAVQKTGEVFMAVGGWIKDTAISVKNWFASNWPLLVSIIAGPFGAAVVLIVKHWDSIKSGATDAVNWVKSKFNIMISFFKGLPGKVAGVGKDMGRSIVNGLIDMINKGTAAINSILAFTIPGVGVGPVSTPDIHINPDDIPRIPHMAMGGTATRGGRALVGEAGGEVVNLPAGARVTPLRTPAALPLSNLATAGGFGGGGDIRVPVYLDGRQIAEAVHRQVERRQNRR